MVQPYEPEMDGAPRSARSARIARDAKQLVDDWRGLDPAAAALGRIRALLSWSVEGGPEQTAGYRAFRDGVAAAVKAADHLLAREGESVVIETEEGPTRWGVPVEACGVGDGGDPEELCALPVGHRGAHDPFARLKQGGSRREY